MGQAFVVKMLLLRSSSSNEELAVSPIDAVASILVLLLPPHTKHLSDYTRECRIVSSQMLRSSSTLKLENAGAAPLVLRLQYN